MSLPIEFPHKAPTKDYSYEYEQFNTRTIRIWLCCTRKFDYNLGAPTKTVWGFYSPKKKEYYAPVNSKTIGKQVSIDNTTSYTAMPLKKTSLEMCFV
jgi:hypothetical protein